MSKNALADIIRADGMTALQDLFDDVARLKSDERGLTPLHLTDAEAANDLIYYSTTAARLVYKDTGGTVHNLY